METKPPPRRRRDQKSALTGTIRVDDDRTLDLLELLHPYWNFKYLTMKEIHAFIGGNEDNLKRRLRTLWDAGYLSRPAQQKFSPNSNYKHLVYEITDKGLILLQKKREISAPRNRHRSHWYEHEVLVDLGFYAPLRHAALADPKLRIHSARDLLNGAAFELYNPSGIKVRVPTNTRESEDPFLITLNDKKTTVRFDGTPLMLERDMSDGSVGFIFIPGIEADRNTEGLTSVSPKDVKRTTLTGHLDEIIRCHLERQFLKHYGFKMMMVPIITTNETHTANAMRYVREKIGSCRYLLFKTLMDIAMLDHFPKPSADFFMSPWKRVGHSDFTFDERGFK